MRLVRCSAVSLTPHTNFTFVTREEVVDTKVMMVCDMYFDIQTSLDNVKVKILTKAGNRTIVSLSLDVCERFLRNKGSWWIKWYQQILHSGLMPEGCPIHPGMYFVKGYQVDTRFYPTFMPILDLTVTTEIYTKQTNQQFVHISHMVWRIKTVKREKKHSPEY